MKTSTSIRPLVLAACMVLAGGGTARAAVGDTYTYSFNVASQGNAVPGAEQATLRLTETALGVDLVLTPNWDGGANRVDQLMFAYSGDSFTFADGAGPTPTVSLLSSTKIDSGYVASPSVIRATWGSNGPTKFGSSTDFTAWSMNGPGITLSDFFYSAATASNKPSPAFGVISMPGTKGGSNWVAFGQVQDPDEGHGPGPGAGPDPGQVPSPDPVVAPIPEPETYALMALGLAIVALGTRRQRQRRRAERHAV